MKAWVWIVIAGVLAAAGLVGWRMNRRMPALKDGDVVFQTSGGDPSMAVAMATHSLYSHIGIVRLTPSGPVVVEAAGPVGETPLRQWIARGQLGRVAVYRDAGLTAGQAAALFRAAGALYGLSLIHI